MWNSYLNNEFFKVDPACCVSILCQVIAAHSGKISYF